MFTFCAKIYLFFLKTKIFELIKIKRDQNKLSNI